MMVNNYFQDHASLTDWRERIGAQEGDRLTPWKPKPLNRDTWPPDYRGAYAWRIQQLAALRASPELLASAKAYYSTRPVEFIIHWIDTYNPRKTSAKWMPFIFFERQVELIQFIHACREDKESGLIEKCRDAGATWCACAYSIWSFLFVDDDAIGWGSRKQDLVDKIGNPDSIFEKMKLILKKLPSIFLPVGFSFRDHATFMRIINPENGSVIMGEAGDNIGRGGRTSIFFKDESAHYERPELIEAALGDNTNTQIDISSVNGLGNVFHRRRESGIEWRPGVKVEKGFTRVFIVDWSDHPEKTQDWYNQRKAKAIREGMQHVFAQEVDRNYSAAVQNTIIDYEWIKAAVDAHKKIRWIDDKGNLQIGFDEKTISNVWTGGLDIADEGADRNGLALRQWIILRDCEEWGERDTGVTTRRAISKARNHKGIKLQYDIIGMGSSVKAEYNRLVTDGIISPNEISLIPWNAGAAVVNPFDRIIPDDVESPLNKDLFGNMKAQAWWSVRTRFYKTFKNITEGDLYPVDELISLDSGIPLLHQIMKEFAQPTRGDSSGLKTIVNKKPKGMKSPNLADAAIMAFFPVDESKAYALTGNYSG